MNHHASSLIRKFLYWVVITGMILSQGVEISSPRVAYAQESAVPALVNTAVSRDHNQGMNVPGQALQTVSGLWFMPESAHANQSTQAQNIISLSMGGPDDFGYTWDDSTPLSWIDTASGADTGLTGRGQNNATDQISLPFPFKFYENTYTSLYISAAGYLSFTDNGNWPDQSSIPSPNVPNNVIAPYWTPTYIGSGSWVHYSFGGSTGNHIFVVEWHNLSAGAPGDNKGQDDTYQFEAILHENGDIVFQYGTNSYNGDTYCGASGIENSSGQDGLSYFVPCNWAPSNKAVTFYRPADSARLSLSPANLGHFTTAGALVPFQVNIRNTGSLGADTYKLTTSSSWSVSLYASDGTTPLTDTNSDGFVDTGPVQQSSMVTITVKMQAPVGAVLGNANTAILTARSSLDASKSKISTLKAAVPAPFVQGFEEDTYAVSMDLVQPRRQDQAAMLDTCGCGENDMAIAQLNGATYFYVWWHAQWVAPVPHSYLEFTIVDNTGSPIVPATKLTDNDAVTTETYDIQPAVAVTPDGHIGILWTRQVFNSDKSQQNQNVFFMVLDAAGGLVWGPTNMTQNSVWGNSGELNWPNYAKLQVSPTGDNHFLLAWQDSYHGSGGDVSQVDYAIRDSLGHFVKDIAQVPMSGLNGFLSANAVSGNQTILEWLYNSDIYYTVLDSSGHVTKAPTNLTNDGQGRWSSDAILLSDGTTAIAWTNNDGSYPGKDQLAFAILDGSFNLLSGPTNLFNPAAIQGNDLISITSDGQAHAIITWAAPWYATRTDLYYALVNSSGTVITQPMSFLSARNTGIGFAINSIGYGNAPYDITTPPTVASINRVNASPTSASIVNFSLTFSEPVTGVDASDFNFTMSGITGASITGISGSHAAYTVTVSVGSGDGTLRLNLDDDDSIIDSSGNPLGGTGIGNGNFTTGQTYTINRLHLYLPQIFRH